MKRLMLRVGKACKRSHRRTCSKEVLAYKEKVALAKAKCSLQTSVFGRHYCLKRLRTKQAQWRKTKIRFCKIAKDRKNKKNLRAQAKVLTAGILHLARYLKRMQNLSMHSKVCKAGKKKYKAARKLCARTIKAKRKACLVKIRKFRRQLQIKVCGLTKHQKAAYQKVLKNRKSLHRTIYQKLRMFENKAKIQRARLALAARKKKLKKLKEFTVRAALKKLQRLDKSTKAVKKSAMMKVIRRIKKKRSQAIARIKAKIRQNRCKIYNDKARIVKARCHRLKVRHQKNCRKKLKKLSSLAALACAGKCKRSRIKYQNRLKKYGAKCAKRRGNAKALCYRTLAAMTKAEYIRVKDNCKSPKNQKCFKSKLTYNNKVHKAMKQCQRRTGTARHLCVKWLVRYTQAEYNHMQIDCQAKAATSKAAKLGQVRMLYHKKLSSKIKAIKFALKKIRGHVKYFHARRQAMLLKRIKSISSSLKSMERKLASAKHMKSTKQLHALGRTLIVHSARMTKRVKKLLKLIQKRFHNKKKKQQRRKKAFQNAKIRKALYNFVMKRVRLLNRVYVDVNKNLKLFTAKRQKIINQRILKYNAALSQLVADMRAALVTHKHKLPGAVLKKLHNRVKALSKHMKKFARSMQRAAYEAKLRMAKKHVKKAKHGATLARLYSMAAAALKAHRIALAKKRKRVAHLNQKIKALHLKVQKHKKIAKHHSAKAQKILKDLKMSCKKAKRQYIKTIRANLKRCLAKGGLSCKRVAILQFRRLKKC